MASQFSQHPSTVMLVVAIEVTVIEGEGEVEVQGELGDIAIVVAGVVIAVAGEVAATVAAPW